MTTPDPTTFTVLGSTIAAMTTAIAVQWKTTMSHLKRVEDKLDECEDDRPRRLRGAQPGELPLAEVSSVHGLPPCQRIGIAGSPGGPRAC